MSNCGNAGQSVFRSTLPNQPNPDQLNNRKFNNSETYRYHLQVILDKLACVPKNNFNNL